MPSFRMSAPHAPARSTLSRLARRLLVEAPMGVDVELPRAGSALENPHVYDAVARELLRERQRVQLVACEPVPAADGAPIRRLVFRRIG
jgi:hypothetical protein